MKVQLDEEGGRILLGDNTDGHAATDQVPVCREETHGSIQEPMFIYGVLLPFGTREVLPHVLGRRCVAERV